VAGCLCLTMLHTVDIFYSAVKEKFPSLLLQSVTSDFIPHLHKLPIFLKVKTLPILPFCRWLLW